MFAAVEKLQRAGGVEEPAVEPDLCRPVEVLEPADLLEAGLAQAQLQAPVVAAAHLVGQDDLQEVGVVEPLAPGEGDALGQGVGHPGYGPLAGPSTTRDIDTFRASADGLISPRGTTATHRQERTIVERNQPPVAAEAVFPEALFAPAGAERALVPAAELSEQAKEAIGRAIAASRSPNTRRSYQVAWRAWEAWARGRGYPPMPAGAETVAAYLTERAAAGAGASTLGMALAAIAAAHGAAGETDPTRSEGVRRIVAGLRRETAGTAGRPGRSPRRPWPPSRRVPRPRRAGARNWRSAGRCVTHCSAVRRRPRSPGPTSSVPTTARGGSPSAARRATRRAEARSSTSGQRRWPRSRRSGPATPAPMLPSR